MGLDKLADLAAGIWERFFSKESIKEKRRNQIEKLEAERAKLMQETWNTSKGARIAVINIKLGELYKHAKND
jgi:hypothetical protein